MTMKLYEIANQVREIAERAKTIDLETGEVTQFDPEAISLLDKMEGAFEDKAEAIAGYIKELEKEVEAMKEAAEHQRSAAGLKQREADGLREYVLACIQGVKVKGNRSIKGNLFSIYELNTKSADVILGDEESVPVEYRRYPPWELKKAEAKKAIEGGETVPGVVVFEKESLVIKERKWRGRGRKGYE